MPTADDYDCDVNCDDETDDEINEDWGSARKMAAIPAFGYLVYMGYLAFTSRDSFTQSGGFVHDNFLMYLGLGYVAMMILGIHGSSEYESSTDNNDSWSDDYASQERGRQEEEERQQRAFEDFCSKGP